MLLLSLRKLFRSVNSKILLVLSVAIIGSAVLFLLAALFIESLVLLWNLAFVACVVLWERHKRDTALTGNNTFSNDETWSRIKRDIERLDGKLEKTRDNEKKRAMLHERRILENELRRAEWSIKESNLNGVYNAGTGNLRKLDPKKMSEEDSKKDVEGEEREKINSWERYTPEGALRQRKKLEREAEERRTLQRIIESAEAILRSEPADSVPAALKSVANDFKAHYNVLKKKGRKRESLSDFWVAWAVISSVMNGVLIDPQVAKYASGEFRPRVTKLIKLANSLYPQNERFVSHDGLGASFREHKSEPESIFPKGGPGKTRSEIDGLEKKSDND